MYKQEIDDGIHALGLGIHNGSHDIILEGVLDIIACIINTLLFQRIQDVGDFGFVDVDFNLHAIRIEVSEEELKLLLELLGSFKSNHLNIGAIITLKGQLDNLLIIFVGVLSSARSDSCLNGSVDGCFFIFHTFIL